MVLVQQVGVCQVHIAELQATNEALKKFHDALKDRVADLEQQVGVLLCAAVGALGGPVHLKNAAAQKPDQRWLGDLHTLASDNLP